MKLAPVLVVNPLPQIEDPVFGSASESRLGQIIEAAHPARLVVVLRAQPHQETLFSFTVDNDIERSSGKSALEICWETLERVQYLNRRIAAYQYPEERIERSGKFYYFLIRVAGIAGGSVAESKFMDDPRNDRRVRDYLAEHECPNYLIESITLSEKEEELCSIAENGKEVRSEVNWFQTMVKMEVGVRNGGSSDKYSWEFQPKEIVRVVSIRENLEHSRVRTYAESPNFWTIAPESGRKKFVPLPVKPWVDSSRATFPNLFGELVLARLKKSGYDVCTQQDTAAPIAVSLKEYSVRYENDESAVRHLPNWCPTCKEYVALSHDGPGGISCEDYIEQRAKKAAQLAAKTAKTLEATCAKEKAKRDKQRKLYMARVAKTLAPYFGAIRDRVILSSRGTVSAVHIDKLDTKMVRKLSQKKDVQTGRKMGVSRARELWNEVTKETTCQPQPTEYQQYQQELL